MKYLITFYFSVFSFLLVSCEDNTTNPFDSIIAQKIIGKWSSSNYEILFNADGTYKSTSVGYYNVTNTKKDSSVMVINANYRIENNVALYSNINIQLTASTSNIDVGFIEFFPELVSIKNDSLFLTPVYVYNKTEGNQNVLEGRWFTKLDCFMRNPNVTITTGTEEFDYYFESQNKYYSESITLRLNGVHNESGNGNYQIENGYLNLGGNKYFRMQIESKTLYLFNNYSYKLKKNT